jgi:hypothetical protein
MCRTLNKFLLNYQQPRWKIQLPIVSDITKFAFDVQVRLWICILITWSINRWNCNMFFSFHITLWQLKYHRLKDFIIGKGGQDHTAHHVMKIASAVIAYQGTILSYFEMTHILSATSRLWRDMNCFRCALPEADYWPTVIIRLIRSPSCVSVFSPYKMLNVWTSVYETRCIYHDTETIWTVYFINASHQSLYVYIARQRLGKNFTAATNTHETIGNWRVVFCEVYVSKERLWVSITVSLLGNDSVKTFPRQRGIIGGVLFCAVRVVSKESRQVHNKAHMDRGYTAMGLYKTIKHKNNSKTSIQILALSN